MTSQPDAGGHFGPYGGRYVPEVLMAPIEELEAAYLAARDDAALPEANWPTCCTITRDVRRRSTSPSGSARRWAARASGSSAKTCCTPARTRSTTAWARRCWRAAWASAGSSRRPARDSTAWPPPRSARCSASSAWSTWARRTCGGSASTSSACACSAPTCAGVANGSATLKDAISEAMRDWVTNVGDTYYLLGSALGSHPYPMMVRDFHKVIGEEARSQILEAEGRLPDVAIACVGGGSNAIGLFHAFIPDAAVRLVGVEAGGRGNQSRRTRGAVSRRRARCFAGRVQLPAAGRERAGVADAFRIGGSGLRDDRARACVAARSRSARSISRRATRKRSTAARQLSRTEGIIPALESAHAVAWAIQQAPAAKGQIFIVNLSGRGDKDIDIYRENFKELEPK